MQRAQKVARPSVYARLETTFIEYAQTMVAEVADTANAGAGYRQHTLDEFIAFRVLAGAVGPSFCLVELGFANDVPDAVLAHPAVAELRRLAGESQMLGNVRLLSLPSNMRIWAGAYGVRQDVMSYYKEHAEGNVTQNALTFLMRAQGMTLAGAVDALTARHRAALARFLDLRAHLPSWGAALDKEIALYVDGLADWIRGADAWTFESGRYFGKRGREIQKTRVVVLEARPGQRLAA